MRSLKVWSSGFGVFFGWGLIAACSASGGTGQRLLPASTAGSSGVGPMLPAPSSNPSSPSAPNAGTGAGVDLGADVGERVAPAGCQQAQRNFVPKIPVVFLLVDRSDTMFNAL